MNGPITMNNNQLIGIANPQFGSSAISKTYFDTRLNTKLDKIISSHLDMKNFGITDLKDPSNDKDGTKKNTSIQKFKKVI